MRIPILEAESPRAVSTGPIKRSDDGVSSAACPVARLDPSSDVVSQGRAVMAQDRLDVVRGLYEAFGSGDMDRVAGAIANTDWHEAEGMPYGGRYRGAGEVFENVFSRIAADVQNFSARPDELLPAGDDRVLAVGRYRGQGRHGDLDIAFAHLWTVLDGEIVKFVQYADTHKYREAVVG
jgi:uncharacterized protein